jgi:hypothetical protein
VLSEGNLTSQPRNLTGAAKGGVVSDVQRGHLQRDLQPGLDTELSSVAECVDVCLAQRVVVLPACSVTAG